MGEQKSTDEEVQYQAVKGWVDYPRNKVIELTQQAKEKGSDARKIILGFAIDVIAYDDANAFGPTLLTFSIKDASLSRRQYIERVDWELSLTELPTEVKDHIARVRNELIALNWGSESRFKVVYQSWKKNVKGWMESYYKSHQDVKDAFQYYLEFEDRRRKESLDTTPTGSFLK